LKLNIATQSFTSFLDDHLAIFFDDHYSNDKKSTNWKIKTLSVQSLMGVQVSNTNLFQIQLMLINTKVPDTFLKTNCVKVFL
jgi:hypothetical protein